MDTFGADRLSATNVTLLTEARYVDVRYAGQSAAQMVQAGKLGDSSRASRVFLWPLVWASLLGIICAFWAHLHIYYHFGSYGESPAMAGGGWGWRRRTSPRTAWPRRTPQDAAGFIAAGCGLFFVIVCSHLRLRNLPWWPFHPLGYALATTNSLDYMWCPFFVAWLLKSLTVRYGGIKMYRATLPFFLGLTLRDYVVPALWGILGNAHRAKKQQYMAFHTKVEAQDRRHGRFRQEHESRSGPPELGGLRERIFRTQHPTPDTLHSG